MKRFKLQNCYNKHVLTQSRELSAENFRKWFTGLLKEHIFGLISSSTPSEKIGGVIAVGNLFF